MSKELKDPTQDAGADGATTGSADEASQGVHPLLGHRTDAADKEITYETALNARRPAYLADHCIYGSAVLPAAAYVEMALAAATAACPGQDVILQGLAIQQAMFLEPDATRAVRTLLTREEPELFSFRVCSRAENDQHVESAWAEHASGKLITQQTGPAPERADLEVLRSTLTQTLAATELYRACHQRGLEYGPQFQAVCSLRTRDRQALGEIRIADHLAAQAAGYRLHPALLDACLQTLAAALQFDDISSALLPVGIDQVRVYVAGQSRVWSHARITADANAGKSLTADIDILTADGRFVASIEGLRIRRVKKKMLARSRQRDAGQAVSRVG